MMNGHENSEDRLWKSRLAAARMAYNSGELHDAERLALRALADAERTTDARLTNAVTLNYLALICLAGDRFAEAEQHLKEAEQAASSSCSAEHYEILGSTLRNMANLKVHQRQYAEAGPLFARAKQLLERCLPESALELAQCLSDTAWMLLLQRRFSEAMPVALEALNTFTNAVDSDCPAAARARFIYNACTCADDEDKLLSLFEATALKVQYEVGPRNPDLVRALNLFAKYLFRTGKNELLEDVQQHFSSVHAL